MGHITVDQQHWVSHTRAFPVSIFTANEESPGETDGGGWPTLVTDCAKHSLGYSTCMSSLILTSNPVESVLGFTSIFPVTHEDMDIAIAIPDSVLRVMLLVTTNNRDPKIETRKWRAWLSFSSGKMM